jgi:Protein of unknown function (DUF2815)
MAQRNTLKTPTGRVSYPSVFEPKDWGDGKAAKYEVTLLFDKKTTDIGVIKAEVDRVLKETWPKNRPAGLKLPIHDGDVEKPEDPVYAGHYFVRFSSKSKPRVVRRVVEGGIARMADIEPGSNVFYAGCYAQVSFIGGSYDVSGSRGVTLYLNNVLFVDDGEPLGSGASDPADDFADEFDAVAAGDSLY